MKLTKQIFRTFMKSLFLIFFNIFLFVNSSLQYYAYGQDTLILAVHPFLPYQEIEKRFAPLADYLSKEIDKEIVVRVGKNYEEHIKAIGNNQVDIAFLGPVSYVKLTQQFGNKPILAGINVNREPYFYGKIITRSDSPLNKLSDLGNGDFAFVDPNSTMGYIVPVYVLVNLNNIAGILNRCRFVGSHENVAIGVLTGDFEAGAVKDETYFKYKDSGLKVLADTPPIPEHVFVACDDLSPLLIEKLNKSLGDLNKSKEGIEILENIKPGITGMSCVDDSNFDILRNILKIFNEKGIIK